jgi:hypothetical protein
MALFGKARQGFREDRDLPRQGSNSGAPGFSDILYVATPGRM